MYRLALKMLIEDKHKFIGMILGLAFSSLIITQQSAIFIGLMTRTYGFISDTPQAEIWVMDPKVQMIDDIKPLKDTDLYRVRGIDGVAWAVPLYKGMIKARLANGTYQNCTVIGIDDSTLIGGPAIIIEGKLQNLRWPDAIIVNKVGAEDKLALFQGPDQPKVPLRVGDQLEINDHRAQVVGICEVFRTFQSQPVVYTTFSRAMIFAPFERKMLSFILVKPTAATTAQDLCAKITQITGLSAYTKQDFKKMTVMYYLKQTGIPINFGLAVFLGLLVGAAIAGQIFYNFTSDNMHYLALFKAMGARNGLLARMTLLQALWVAFIGWGLGVGCASLIGFLARKTELSFRLPWQLFVGSGVVMILICLMASIVSIIRIFKIEPANVFKR